MVARLGTPVGGDRAVEDLVQAGEQLGDREIGEARALPRPVEARDVVRVYLVVVAAEGRGVDVRGERVPGVGQGREGVGQPRPQPV